MKVLGVIPARAGSKSVPRKNLAEVNGRPLLSYIVEAARRAHRLDRVVVSTEDEEVAAVARQWGAEVPFLRPAELAADEVSLVPVVRHAMKEMDRRNFVADVVVSLQATSPFLESEDIDRAIETLLETGADSVVSVERNEHAHPYWTKRLEGDRVLPFSGDTNEAYLQRQDLPPAYIFDGALFARRRHLLESWSGGDFGLGDDVRALVLGGRRSLHVDDPIHLETVRALARTEERPAETERVSLGGHRLGPGEPAFVLAEVASAHQGDAEQAIELARAARRAGASGVKFQLFRAAELIAPRDSRLPTFQQIELSMDDWKRVLGEVVSWGLPVLADVFDRTSLELGEERGVTAYKIHSTDMENPDFIRAVAATGKPVLLSTGGSGLPIVEEAIELVRAEGNESIVLLHGVQNFPTRLEDSHLRYIGFLKDRFHRPVGFLDHVDGGSPMAVVLPALALAFGADLIEKHVTLDRSAKGFDYESALEPGAFEDMVSLLRETESALGSATPPEDESARRYHGLMRRAALSRERLRKGVPLRRDQLAFVRSETGVSPKEASRLLGRKPVKDVPAWVPLTEELFESP